MLALFIYQFRRINALSKRLKTRVLINGTRGKSSTTRLITAGLKADASNIVLGKTTGTQAMWILPNDDEVFVKRHSSPNIKEMAEGLRLAKKLNANTYVAECMAVGPQYQDAVQRYYMHSDIVAITNIRPDHEDEMGAGLLAIAAAIALSIPENAIIVTTAEAKELLMQVCKNPTDAYRIADAQLGESYKDRFKEPVIPINLAIALTACKELGISHEAALAKMIAAPMDPGNLQLKNLHLNGKDIDFVGAFAANDYVSTLMLAEMYKPAGCAENTFKIIWLHARTDRKQRTVELCKHLPAIQPDIVLISEDTEFAKREWLKHAPELSLRATPSIHFMDASSSSGLEQALGQIIADLPVSIERIWLFGAGNTKRITTQIVGEAEICQKLSWV
jgi:poly-gamma-glutamate synthase PgsB/CapB